MDHPSPALLEKLRCPITRQRLRPVPRELLPQEIRGPQLEAGAVIEGGLVTEDGALAYPISGGIPILLADHAIDLKIPLPDEN